MTACRSSADNRRTVWPQRLIESASPLVILLLGLAVWGAVLGSAPETRADDAGRPRIAVGAPVDIGVAAATLRGTVKAPAARRTARFRWEYGTLRMRRHTRARRVGSSRPVRVTARLTGLRPGTRYRFRLMATTCGGCRRGTARSAVRTFTTHPPVPRMPPAPPGQPPAPTPSPAMSPTYENPVAAAVADPSVVDAADAGHDYYLYATGDRFPIWRSPDLVHWGERRHRVHGAPAVDPAVR